MYFTISRGASIMQSKSLKDGVDEEGGWGEQRREGVEESIMPSFRVLFLI